MSANSKIEWCDHTHNHWIGCNGVSPGCEHCYAEEWAKRYGRDFAKRTRTKTQGEPLKWNAQHAAFFAAHGRRQRVFCASLSDWLDNQVPIEWFVDLLELIRTTPNLDWLMLSKRIGNAVSRLHQAQQYICETWPAVDAQPLSQWLTDWLEGDNPPRNVWIGATIVNQEEADRDIPKLMGAPATTRFLSMEPLLGPVDISKYMWPVHPSWPAKYRSPADAIADGALVTYKRQGLISVAWANRLVTWVIVGGESGTWARAMHPDWVRSLRDQCEAAGVPFLFKQWGEWRSICQGGDDWYRSLYKSLVKAKPHEDQAVIDEIYGRKCTVPQLCLRRDGQHVDITSVNAFLAGTGPVQAFRVGKKAAGRELDGRTWDGFPT